MATPMERAQYEALTNLEVALSAVFKDEILTDDPITTLYNVKDSAEAIERNQMRGGFGKVPTFNKAIEYDSMELTHRADYQHAEYADGFAIARQLIDDEKYGVMAEQAQDLGTAFDYTITQDRVATFNNAFDATNFPGLDDVALCSDSHPHSPTDATNQDNLRTNAFSHQVIAEDRRDMLRFKNSRGLEAPSRLDGILVPPDLVEEALVVTGSTQKSGTADNDTNTLSPVQVFSSPFLTDTNNWFSIDIRKARRFLRWYWRVRPEFAADPTSDFGLQLRFRGYARWSKGWDDWRWLIGHQVP